MSDTQKLDTLTLLEVLEYVARQPGDQLLSDRGRQILANERAKAQREKGYEIAMTRWRESVS